MSIQGGIRGIDVALRAWLRNYIMPDNFPGIQACVLALTIPDWSTWSWTQNGSTGNIAAGATTTQVLFTVPDDERAYLHGIYALVASGDNTIDGVGLGFPAAYSSGGVLDLLQLATANAQIYWPHVGQTINRGIGPTPVLLEPGTNIQLFPSGAGAAITTISFNMSLRRTKLIRQLDP